MTRKIIIFSQGPADIQYTLQIIEENPDAEIHLYCVNVKNVWNFYMNSGVSAAKIRFIPHPSLRNPFTLLRQFFLLRKIWKNDFSTLTGATVYFFGDYYDYVTTFFVHRLSPRNQIRYCNIYPFYRQEIKPFGFFLRLRIFILWLLTGIWYRTIAIGEVTAFAISSEDYSAETIEIRPNPEKISRYYYRPTLAGEGSHKVNILFFESAQASFYFGDYESILLEVMKLFKGKGTVWLKPHPRKGYSPFLDRFAPEIIPDFVPSELVDYSCFDLVFGVETVAVASALKLGAKSAYSLIELFDCTQGEWKKNLLVYLGNVSHNKINYVKNMNELEKILKSL